LAERVHLDRDLNPPVLEELIAFIKGL